MRSDSFAASAARHLGSLPDPYDLGQVAAAFEDGRLLGLTLEARGELEFGGSLLVGESFAIAAEAGASMGLSLGIRVRRSGHFALSVVPGSGETAGEILVEIEELRSHAQANAAGLDVSADSFGSLAERLLEHSEAAEQRLLRVFSVLLPPSRAMRKDLGPRLDKALGGDAAADLLAAAMGAGDAAEAASALRERLLAEIDAFAGVWCEPAVSAASSIADNVLASADLPPGERALLAGRIGGLLARAIARFQEDYRFALESRVITGQAFENTADLLSGLGLQVDRRLSAIDKRIQAVAAPIARLLRRLQGTMLRIFGAVTRSAEVKLEARWQREQVRSGGSKVSQRLSFRPRRPESGALFRSALTGTLDEVLTAGRGEDPDAPVQVLDGKLRRFARVDDQSVLDIALLDFTLVQKKLLRADVEIETDQAGNLRVKSAGGVGVDSSLGTEQRSLGIVNVFEPATATRTRRMTLSMTLSHREQDLSDKEIRQFFRGPEQAALGLIPKETGEEAIRQLHHARAAEPGRITRAELKLWLDLGGDQLLRLLQVTDREAGPFAADNALDAGNVYEQAVQAMIAANDASIGVVRIEMANMRRVVAERALGSDLEDALNRRRKLGFGGATSTTDIAGLNSLQQLDRMRRRANAFVDALEKMREVYFAQPGEWDLKRYLDHQEQIDRDIMTWVEGELLNRLIFPLINNEVRPYVLSLFKVVAESAGLEEMPGRKHAMEAGLFLHKAGGTRIEMLT